MSVFDIELANAEHLSAIPTIELAASTMFKESDLPLAIRYRVTDDAALREAQSDSRLWVALSDDRLPIGFAMASILDGAAHLDELDVLPDYTRQGIGTRLAKTVINWARTKGFSALTLITFRHVPWNAPFYERLGFKTMTDFDSCNGIASLLREESEAGINIENRTIMKLHLDHC